jgi:hypothetical protein
MLDVAKCDRIFDYLLQEKQIKLPSGHVIPSPEQLKSIRIINGIILILMLLMIAMFSVDRFNRSEMGTIEICRKSQNEAQQGPIFIKHAHGRAQWEECPSSAISGQADQGQESYHRRRTATEDDQTKMSEGQPMAEE